MYTLLVAKRQTKKEINIMHKTVKIVADSSADILELDGIGFKSAPLKIITAEKEYTDDNMLDVTAMVNDLQSYKGRSSTSCPNENDWLEAFGDADDVFCVTITGTLSGSYNSAVMAKRTYEEEHEGRRVFVINSLSAGPELLLIIEKLRELIVEDHEYDTICEKITSYMHSTGLLFMLESMKNLANNGRVSHVTAKMAGLLGIRVVGKASDRGDLEPLNKCRGEEKAISVIAAHLKEMGLKGGRVRISHCQNLNAAERLRDIILSELPEVDIKIKECGGLCSFYAEKGGMLIGFEKL